MFGFGKRDKLGEVKSKSFNDIKTMFTYTIRRRTVIRIDCLSTIGVNIVVDDKPIIIPITRGIHKVIVDLNKGSTFCVYAIDSMNVKGIEDITVAWDLTGGETMINNYTFVPSDYKPVVGEMCQWMNDNGFSGTWQEGFHVGNCRNGHKIMELSDNTCVELNTTKYTYKFKPVKSYKQKFVEAGMEVNRGLGIGSSEEGMFEALYDAGFKAPDNKLNKV